MATPAERPNPPFPDDIADEIGKQLQLTLAELIALSLAVKESHWNTYGREFLSAHRHLDLMVDEWRELEDGVAERGDHRHASRRQRGCRRRPHGVQAAHRPTEKC